MHILVEDTDNREVYECIEAECLWELSVLSSQFCLQPKISLKVLGKIPKVQCHVGVGWISPMLTFLGISWYFFACLACSSNIHSTGPFLHKQSAACRGNPSVICFSFTTHLTLCSRNSLPFHLHACRSYSVIVCVCLHVCANF